MQFIYAEANFSIRIETYAQSCTDTRFFRLHHFISAGNSSLKGMTAPWWLFTMCVQLEETDAGLAVGLSKTS